MNDLHISINAGERQTYDETRSHLILNGNLRFWATIKEYSDDYEALLSLTGEDKVTRTKELTEKYSQNSIRWVFLRVGNRFNPQTDYGLESLPYSNLPKAFTFPTNFVGGGKVWIQPFLKANGKPSMKRPHGCYVSAFGKPKIHQTLWTDLQNNRIEGAIAFGSRVRLHIYTQDLFGQEVEIQLVDRDIFSPNDSLAITENNPSAAVEEPIVTAHAFRREVETHDVLKFENELGIDIGTFKHIDLSKKNDSTNGPEADKTEKNNGKVVRQKIIQKTTIDVFIDPYWGITAGEELKIFPIIKLEATGSYLKFDREYLKVEENAIKYEGSNLDFGNTAVVVGKVETNIRAFDPCRYTQINAGFDGDPTSTLFSEGLSVNTGSDTINTGLVTHKENKKKFRLQVKNVDTDGCLEDGKVHVENVIDTAILTELGFEFEHKEGGNPEVSFVPQFPYEHIEANNEDFLSFLLKYFPVIFGNTGVSFQLPVNTCAYTKNVNFIIYPDVLFSAHLQIGDVSNKSKNFYKGLKVPLIKGLNEEFDMADRHMDFMNQYLKYLPGGAIQGFIQEMVMDYLRGEAESFAVGLHAYHTFTRPLSTSLKHGSDYQLMDYSVEYPLIPKAIIAYGVMCSVVLDAALIFFTGGGYAAVKGTVKATSIARKTWNSAKLVRRRFRQVNAVKDLATGNLNTKADSNYTQWDFIAPSIINNKGIGFVQDENGGINLELTEKVAASPLFAMKYSVKGGWEDFIAGVTGITTLFDGLEIANNIVGQILRAKSLKDDVDKANDKISSASKSEKAAKGMAQRTNNRQGFLDRIEESIKLNLKEFAKKYGQEGEIEIYFSGFIDAHYELRLNNAKGLNLTIYDEKGQTKGSYDNSTGVTYGCDYGIVVGVKLQLKSEFTIKWSKLEAYVPKFLGEGNFTDTDINFEVDGELAGSMHYETSYVRNGSGPLMKQQVIICTGIRGVIYMALKVEKKKKNGDKNSWELKKGKERDKNDTTPLLEKPAVEYTELLRGFKIPFNPEPVFDESLKKYFD